MPKHTDQVRITVDLTRRPEMRAVFDRLMAKTGMRNSIDIIALALNQLDANLPARAVEQPMEKVAH